MNKHDLVELTIERLLANFERSPESFDLKDDPSKNNGYGGYTVIWKPRVQLGSYDSNIVDDPNNNHAVVITTSPVTNEIICYLFIKSTVGAIETAKADYSVASDRPFMTFRSHYRKLKKLIKLIKERDIYKENMTYLSKLSSVFPDTLDKHILKD